MPQTSKTLPNFMRAGADAQWWDAITELQQLLAPLTNGLLSYPPASDQQIHAQNVISTAAGAPVAGTVYIEPIDIGVAQAFKGLAVNVTTALVAGSATVTTTGALYFDNGTMGAPDFTKRVGNIITFDSTSTGNKYVAFSSVQTLAPGRYWAAFLYTASVAPTTAPQFTCVTGALSLPYSGATAAGTQVKTYQVASLAALPTTAQTLAANGGNVAPVVALRAN
jgi:hypothetical protein